MTEDFRPLMLGAMYENGGYTIHRLLDGHPSGEQSEIRGYC